ncbi:hypothetical protein B0H16DRAFT_1746383 [Mycena metata]|uniref:Uncharacterized protein n=1 Tax=Mycena metata TaxID=1033252 RepID=A0AAD7MA95_9AGAR|nr:hypothetical protein B0H16DRAFT_1746383 [Mycena metata]
MARTRWYEEEVRLLQEEMRRTIAFGRTEAAEWDRLAEDKWEGSSAEVTEGRRAHAVEHADTERAWCKALEKVWAGILQKAVAYLAGDISMVAGTVTVELEGADELDPELEEARLEREEDNEDEGGLPAELQ